MNNQILNGISNRKIKIIKEINDKEYWFVFYNLILKDSILRSDLDNSITKYLIPDKAYDGKNPTDKNYFEFYKLNLEENIAILNNIDELDEEIKEYLRLK